MTKETEREDRKLTFRRLTVAQLREDADSNDIEVVFLESARFYRLPEDPVQSARILAALKRSMTSGTPVDVGLPGQDGDMILAIQEDGDER